MVIALGTKSNVHSLSYSAPYFALNAVLPFATVTDSRVETPSSRSIIESSVIATLISNVVISEGMKYTIDPSAVWKMPPSYLKLSLLFRVTFNTTAPENASASIVSIVEGIVMFSSVKPENASASIEMYPSGITSSVSAVFANAFAPIVAFSLALRVTLARLLQPENALSPIEVYPSGITIFVSAVFVNALAPIVASSPAASTTFTRLLEYANAF